MEYKNRFEQALQASRALNLLDKQTINQVLIALATKVETQAEFILAENSKDLAKMDAANPKYDRLKLTHDRIVGIATEIRHVAELPSPLNRIKSTTRRPNGITLTKISVPFGVIGIIYEARPNVTLDVFSLCLKSGNAVILKGSSDAEFSNLALIEVIHTVLKKFSIANETATLLPSNHTSTTELLQAVGFVDVIIPRGGKQLIDFVRQNSTVPVIETGAGICHTYFDEFGDLEKGKAIIHNAKTRRVSVCNALDCLIIHQKRLTELPQLCTQLIEHNVLIYADELAFEALEKKYPEHLLIHATEDSFGTEFLDYKLAIKTVSKLDDALSHIATFSSKHSECIISEDVKRLAQFSKQVDAACVYSNVSTAFTDGAQFGLGAEIGISTQKLHARGPMALNELTSYKWLIAGDGQIREN